MARLNMFSTAIVIAAMGLCVLPVAAQTQDQVVPITGIQSLQKDINSCTMEKAELHQKIFELSKTLASLKAQIDDKDKKAPDAKSK